jgi:hypothetical protein
VTDRIGGRGLLSVVTITSHTVHRKCSPTLAGIERVAQHQQLPPFRVRVAAFPWFVSPVRRDKHHGLSCLSLPDTPRKARCGVGNCRFYTTLGPFDLRWGKTIKKKRPTPPESFPHTPDPFPLDHPTVPHFPVFDRLPGPPRPPLAPLRSANPRESQAQPRKKLRTNTGLFPSKPDRSFP